MDISCIVAKSRDIELTHPATGENVGLTVTLLSQDSDEVKAAHRLNRDMYGGEELDTEAIKEMGINVLAAAIKGWQWHGEGSFQGKQIKCTDENKKKILAIPAMYSQLDREFGNYRAFFDA